MAKVLWVLKQSLANRLYVYPIAQASQLAGHHTCIQLTPKDQTKIRLIILNERKWHNMNYSIASDLMYQ